MNRKDKKQKNKLKLINREWKKIEKNKNTTALSRMTIYILN
jgi:hypothetical protein